MTTPRAPAGLGPRGRALWRAVYAEFDVGTAERELLIEACRTSDELDRLDKALRDQPRIVSGSKGQVAGHPLLRDLGAMRHLYGRLLAQLGFDASVAGEEWDGLSSSARARKAAHARWRGSRAS